MTFFRGKTIDKLEDCFRAYTEEEKLEGNEAYFCPTCKARHSATKALRIHRFPHCLVLHIKRFKGFNRTHYKLSSNVTFPLHGLNLAPFSTAVKGASRSDREQPPGLYDLYAVSNHTGSLDSGHYTAYVKVADPEHEDEQKWLLLADDKVSDVRLPCPRRSEAVRMQSDTWRQPLPANADCHDANDEESAWLCRLRRNQSYLPRHTCYFTCKECKPQRQRMSDGRHSAGAVKDEPWPHIGPEVTERVDQVGAGAHLSCSLCCVHEWCKTYQNASPATDTREDVGEDHVHANT